MNRNFGLTNSLLYDWIPEYEFNSYDLSELLVLNEELEKECKSIESEFKIFLAIYKKGTVAKPKGLCTTFKYADLGDKALLTFQKFENKINGNILVAYANPLERW
ncbi:hypothetical protein [Leptospira brenneri]|uniref:Uncharacterized protein n=1 Tax=Leptospira brenneri TaxID=2023182 RepID=A0A2M9XYL1_9LEPT|nr:hypothetical protein [Leptospira brenneri]PJZ44253.1 hypothetical protein CH361_16560 [Leptospira brenneri]TGK92915.1 hypothetical protein EHQ30_11825 [Leptospira brenneri]